MDMSKAALPAISGKATQMDTFHPLYSAWRNTEARYAAQMINGQDFKDWLYQREQNAYRDDWAKHPQYRAFLAWMRETQGGARKCPAGVFPENFKFWLDGGRW